MKGPSMSSDEFREYAESLLILGRRMADPLIDLAQSAAEATGLNRFIQPREVADDLTQIGATIAGLVFGAGNGTGPMQAASLAARSAQETRPPVSTPHDPPPPVLTRVGTRPSRSSIRNRRAEARSSLVATPPVVGDSEVAESATKKESAEQRVTAKATVEKSAVTTSASKKATTGKSAAKKAPAATAAAKKSVAKKSAAKKATTRKSAAKKSAAKKATTRKSAAKKSAAKKATTGKSAAKQSAAKQTTAGRAAE
ncbi:MAG: histone H1-like repetitive region-containing protein [Nostocoides sp.]